MSLSGRTEAVRIGIFGGTFDPPHIGHLVLAAEARDQLELDRVLWVVTPNPPHKRDRVISPLEVRLELVQAALEGDAAGKDRGFEISMVEIDRPAPHYSVDTVRLLRAQNPGAALFYLMGGDSLHDLPTWKHPETLIACLEGIGVMRRPQDLVDLDWLERALPGVSARLRFVDAPLLEISSTDIRERIAAGRHYRYFLPPAVYAKIEARGFYQSTSKEPS